MDIVVDRDRGWEEGGYEIEDFADKNIRERHKMEERENGN